MIRIKAKKIYQSDYFPFFVLTVGMLAIHMVLPMNTGDDTFFSVALDERSLPAYLHDRYFNWTSRMIIETILVSILHFPLIVWRIIDTAIILFFGVSISNLIVHENKRVDNWFITFLLFSYPFLDMDTAGWVATTTNTLWVLAFGVYVILIVKKVLLQQIIRKYEYIFSIVALIYAANQEQMCVVLLAVFLFSFFYIIKIKRPNGLIFGGLAICLASLIFILTCPGNAARKHSEVKWFQDFDHISVIDKLEIGVSSTLAHYLLEPNLLFVIFSILLCAAVHIKYADRLYRFYSDIPIAVTLFFGVWLKFASDLFPGLSLVNSQMTEHGLITLDNFTKLKSYVSIFILCTSFCLVLISLYLVFENSLQGICAVGTMLLGFLSRVIMGFSPTVWASSTRTYIYMYGAIIICSTMLFYNIVENRSKFVNKFVMCTGFAAAISTLNMLMIL